MYEDVWSRRPCNERYLSTMLIACLDLRVEANAEHQKGMQMHHTHIHAHAHTCALPNTHACLVLQVLENAEHEKALQKRETESHIHTHMHTS